MNYFEKLYSCIERCYAYLVGWSKFSKSLSQRTEAHKYNLLFD